jgi:hypothetical protein
MKMKVRSILIDKGYPTDASGLPGHVDELSYGKCHGETENQESTVTIATNPSFLANCPAFGKAASPKVQKK